MKHILEDLHPRSLPFRMLVLLALVTTCVIPATVSAAQEPRPTAILHGDRLLAPSKVPRRIVPPVDLPRAAREDARDEMAGRPPRFAIPRPVHITPETDGVWEEIDGNTSVWRLEVTSRNALSLNLGFKEYHMPEGGRMFLYSPDYGHGVRPFTAKDNAAHGELWTPVVLSEAAVIEVTLPTSARDELRLELTSINVGYRGFGKAALKASGSCNMDVACPEGDPWRDEIASVAVISRGGSRICSGFMVNNSAQDQRPYFITAKHCGVTTSNAASLVAYWNYETSTCNGIPDGSLDQFNTGSYWRADYSPSDFTLVELDEDPHPAWGITFAGWDRSGDDAGSAVTIHHPSVEEKRISFEYDPTTTTSYLGSGSPGDGTHIRVADWDMGTTEGGSSGAPLFSPDHQVIGQLHGGYAACGNDLADWYGKFSVSWEGGGTTSTRLKDWLDPGNTGTTSVNTLVPGQECWSHEDCDDGLFCNGQEICQNHSCMQGADPCPGQECDEEDDVCFSSDCDDDGVCEAGEDCNGCPNDCFSGTSSATCGNKVCEIGTGEDCISCPEDCNGIQGGKPSRRYCCGDGEGQNAVGCEDWRCHENGNTCTFRGTGTSSCCGDGTCEGEETRFNCGIDCGPEPTCGDGLCDGPSDENPCACPVDCGAPDGSEVPGSSCEDGIDNDCDGFTDVEDLDCVSGCLPVGDSCTTDSQCCTGKCLGKKGKKVCK